MPNTIAMEDGWLCFLLMHSTSTDTSSGSLSEMNETQQVWSFHSQVFLEIFVKLGPLLEFGIMLMKEYTVSDSRHSCSVNFAKFLPYAKWWKHTFPMCAPPPLIPYYMTSSTAVTPLTHSHHPIANLGDLSIMLKCFSSALF